ncbi:Protein RISC-INTERACTING CLEARING 3'-5' EXORIBONUCLEASE 1 [Linum grandiflorum]
MDKTLRGAQFTMSDGNTVATEVVNDEESHLCLYILLQDMFKVGDMVVGLDIEWGFKSTSSSSTSVSRSTSFSGSRTATNNIPVDPHQQPSAGGSPQERNTKAGTAPSERNTKVVEQHAALITLCTKLGCVLIRLNPKLPTFSPSLRKFLAIKEILFVGVHIREDLHRLKKMYGVVVRNAVELSDLAAKMNDHPRFLGFSARDLCSKVCSIKLEQKPFVVLWSNWFDPTLSNEQVESATTDAYAAYKTGRKIMEGGSSSVKKLFY